jgi:hypothetical protein
MARRFFDNSFKTAQMRALIAEAAARFIAEHGIRDYGLAKRKAARHLDLPEGHSLPSNEEVDQALIARQNLYDPAEQAALLLRLRNQALEVMEIFEHFHPVLTGPVASGAVSEHSNVELDIQTESSKEFEQFLVNRGIEFKIQDRAGQMGYLIFAEPADVLVRLPIRDGHGGQAGHRPQMTIKQLRKLTEAAT